MSPKYIRLWNIDKPSSELVWSARWQRVSLCPTDCESQNNFKVFTLFLCNQPWEEAANSNSGWFSFHFAWRDYFHQPSKTLLQTFSQKTTTKKQQQNIFTCKLVHSLSPQIYMVCCRGNRRGIASFLKSKNPWLLIERKHINLVCKQHTGFGFVLF